MTDRPIRLVLDSTAVLAYAHGSEAVGETIREVVDEDACYALPMISLAEAAAKPGMVAWIAAVTITRCRTMVALAAAELSANSQTVGSSAVDSIIPTEDLRDTL